VASRKATATVVALAEALQAEVTVAAAAVARSHRITEWDFEPAEQAIPTELAERWARDESTWLAEQGITADVRVLEGRAAEALAKYAAEGAFDLLVVGHRGRSLSGIPRLGSVAAELPDLAHCPVVIVP
jgi:nucleotide-binding universal stress UspA family protein